MHLHSIELDRADIEQDMYSRSWSMQIKDEGR